MQTFFIENSVSYMNYSLFTFSSAAHTVGILLIETNANDWGKKENTRQRSTFLGITSSLLQIDTQDVFC